MPLRRLLDVLLPPADEELVCELQQQTNHLSIFINCYVQRAKLSRNTFPCESWPGGCPHDLEEWCKVFKWLVLFFLPTNLN